MAAGARRTGRAGVLFRDEVAPERALPRPRVIVATLAIAAALLAFAILPPSRTARVLLLPGHRWRLCRLLRSRHLLTWAARRLPRPRRPELALALANLGAPGGLTRSVVLSLGAGLSLLVTVALVDASIVTELDAGCPRRPNYFVLDVPKAIDAFDALVRGRRPPPRCTKAPMLRGRLIKLGDRPAEEVKAPPEAEWVLTGDRGLTYADELPEGSQPWSKANGGRRTMPASRWSPSRPSSPGPRPQDRRQGHRQRARPQPHGHASPTCAR